MSEVAPDLLLKRAPECRRPPVVDRKPGEPVVQPCLRLGRELLRLHALRTAMGVEDRWEWSLTLRYAEPALDFLSFRRGKGHCPPRSARHRLPRSEHRAAQCSGLGGEGDHPCRMGRILPGGEDLAP